MNDYYQNLPKKRMGAGILFFNENGELLIVKPSYKDHWSIPGGVVDENESPRDACIREAKEEIGFEIKDPKFLSVDYYANRSAQEKGEAIQFLFYGGIMKARDVEILKLAEGEIAEIKFMRKENALPLLSDQLQKRLLQAMEALRANTPVYLENGEIPIN